MRRRGRGAGPFRRPFRRAAPFTVPPELRRANELMASGQHAEAAIAFENIAERADARRGPRAPLFYLRAGQAYALAHNISKGMQHIKKGLNMIAARRDWAPLQRFGQRAVDELNELGFSAEAQEIADYLSATLPASETNTLGKQSRASLPTHCPACGAAVRVDEVEWLNNDTAECIYCGSPVQGED